MMLKHCFKLSNNIHTCILKRGLCSPSGTEKWDLITAVCLERKPIVTPQLNEIEQQFQNLLSQVEQERSLKSDHEIRHEQEQKQQELLKKGDDVDISAKETAQDLFDAWNEELAKFKVGSRVTADDKINNLKSLNRKLDKYLVLLVKQQLGEKEFFLLPQGRRQEGESLRQAAERILKESCGTDIKAQFYGNAPSGFYKYKYPKSVQNEAKSVGAKVFIYLAKHCTGNLSNQESEFKWLDRTELAKELNPDYHNSIAQFLIDEQ